MNAVASTGTATAHTIRANSIDIAYQDIGDGPPLVVLHGALASTGPTWIGSPVSHVDHFPTLAEHFRVIAPDTRGSGATAHNSGPATFDVLAADVLALVDVLELDRPVIAGFSEGGATATVAALSRPDRFRGLINHGGFDYFSTSPEMFAEFRAIFGGDPTAQTANPDAAEAVFQSAPPTADVFTRMKADYDGAQGSGYWRRYLDQFFQRTTTGVGMNKEDLGRLSLPTLVLVGDRDYFCPAELAVETHRAIPGSELSIIPGTGHEITRPLVDAMIEFTERVVAG